MVQTEKKKTKGEGEEVRQEEEREGVRYEEGE